MGLGMVLGVAVTHESVSDAKIVGLFLIAMLLPFQLNRPAELVFLAAWATDDKDDHSAFFVSGNSPTSAVKQGPFR